MRMARGHSRKAPQDQRPLAYRSGRCCMRAMAASTCGPNPPTMSEFRPTLPAWCVSDMCLDAAQVHALQALLNTKGFHCGEDDTVWWQFGMDTYSSLLTYQVWHQTSLYGRRLGSSVMP